MKPDWIKMTDRRPTEQDLPVWVYSNDGALQGINLMHIVTDAWPYWRPAKDDIPEPPMEETQEDKDEAAWRSWQNDSIGGAFTHDAWHAALAWERGEVAKMLPVSHEVAKTIWPNTSQEQHIAAIESIRARCGGGNK